MRSLLALKPKPKSPRSATPVNRVWQQTTDPSASLRPGSAERSAPEVAPEHEDDSEGEIEARFDERVGGALGGAGAPADDERRAPSKPRLYLGAPTSAHERHADAVAEQLLGDRLGVPRALASFPLAPSARPLGAELDPGMTARIQAIRRRPGRSLPADLRRRMQAQLRVELGDIRVHTGAEVVALAGALEAEAFNVGRDVFWGRHDPVDGPSARSTLVHEVVHSIQPGAATLVRRKLKLRSAMAKNEQYWDELHIAWLDPLKPVTIHNDPEEFARRVHSAQQSLRESGLDEALVGERISADGVIGPKTLLALIRLFTKRPPEAYESVVGDVRQEIERIGFDSTAIANNGIRLTSIVVAKILQPKFAQPEDRMIWGEMAAAAYEQQYKVNPHDREMLDDFLFGEDGKPEGLQVSKQDRVALLEQLLTPFKVEATVAWTALPRPFASPVDVDELVKRHGKKDRMYMRFLGVDPESVDRYFKAFSLEPPKTVDQKEIATAITERALDPLAHSTSGALLIAVYLPRIVEGGIQGSGTMTREFRDQVVSTYFAVKLEAIRKQNEEALAASLRRIRELLDLGGSYRDLTWGGKMRDVLMDFEPIPASFFEQALEQLDREGRRAELFETITNYGDLELLARLVRLTAATKFADTAAYVDAELLVAERQEEFYRGDYDVDDRTLTFSGIGWMQKIEPGMVLGEIGSAYRAEREETLIKPPRLEEVKQLFDEIATAKINAAMAADEAEVGQQTFDELLDAALTEATEQAAITEDDYETVTRQRSVQFWDIRYRPGKPRFSEHIEVKFEIVERTIRDDGQTPWEPIHRDPKDKSFTVDKLPFVPVAELERHISAYSLGASAEGFKQGAMVSLAIAGAFLAGATGAGGAALRLAGGVRNLAINMTLSEGIYVITTALRHEPFTLTGFLSAAIDGYISAVGGKLIGAKLPALFGRTLTAGTQLSAAAARRVVIQAFLARGASDIVEGIATGVAGTLVKNLIFTKEPGTFDEYMTAAWDGAVSSLIFGIAGRGFAHYVRGKKINQNENLDVSEPDITARDPDPSELLTATARFRKWTRANFAGWKAAKMDELTQNWLQRQMTHLATGYKANTFEHVLEVDTGISGVGDSAGAMARITDLEGGMKAIETLKADPEVGLALMDALADAPGDVWKKLLKNDAKLFTEMADSPHAIEFGRRFGSAPMFDMMGKPISAGGGVRGVNEAAAWINALEDARAREVIDHLTRYPTLSPKIVAAMVDGGIPLNDDLILGAVEMSRWAQRNGSGLDDIATYIRKNSGEAIIDLENVRSAGNPKPMLDAIVEAGGPDVEARLGGEGIEKSSNVARPDAETKQKVADADERLKQDNEAMDAEHKLRVDVRMVHMPDGNVYFPQLLERGTIGGGYAGMANVMARANNGKISGEMMFAEGPAPQFEAEGTWGQSGETNLGASEPGLSVMDTAIDQRVDFVQTADIGRHIEANRAALGMPIYRRRVVEITTGPAVRESIPQKSGAPLEVPDSLAQANVRIKVEWEDGKFAYFFMKKADVAAGPGTSRRIEFEGEEAALAAKPDGRADLIYVNHDLTAAKISKGRVIVVGNGATAEWTVETAYRAGAKKVIWIPTKIGPGMRRNTDVEGSAHWLVAHKPEVVKVVESGSYVVGSDVKYSPNDQARYMLPSVGPDKIRVEGDQMLVATGQEISSFAKQLEGFDEGVTPMWEKPGAESGQRGRMTGMQSPDGSVRFLGSTGQKLAGDSMPLADGVDRNTVRNAMSAAADIQPVDSRGVVPAMIGVSMDARANAANAAAAKPQPEPSLEGAGGETIDIATAGKTVGKQIESEDERGGD